MRLVITLLPVLALACGGGSKSSPPPAAPLPPEEGTAPTGEGQPSGAEGEGAVTKPAGARLCPEPADDGKPAPAATQAEIDAMATRGIAMMDEIAVVFAANAEDCNKLAAQLSTFISANCTDLNEFRAFSKRTSKQQQDAFNARYSDKMMAIGMKMMPAIQKCQNDAALADLMGQMQQP